MFNILLLPTLSAVYSKTIINIIYINPVHTSGLTVIRERMEYLDKCGILR